MMMVVTTDGPSPSGPYLSGPAGVIQARGLKVRFTSGPLRIHRWLDFLR
jgi:hypothetical protein